MVQGIELQSKICRVLDWDKFRDLLERFADDAAWHQGSSQEWQSTRPRGRMWFALPHAFSNSDPKEATFPAINLDPEQYCDMVARNLGLDEEEALAKKTRFLASPHESMIRYVQQLAGLCGMSCWYGEPEPSSNMWKYGGDEPLAVQTTVAGLLRSLCCAVGSYSGSSKPRIAKVQYVCHGSHELIESGVYALLAIKSDKFLDENEVRVVARSPWIKTVLQQMRSTEDVHGSSAEASPGSGQNILDESTIGEFQKLVKSLEESGVRGFTLPCCLGELFKSGNILLPCSASSSLESKIRSALNCVGLSAVNVIRQDDAMR